MNCSGSHLCSTQAMPEDEELRDENHIRSTNHSSFGGDPPHFYSNAIWKTLCSTVALLFWTVDGEETKDFMWHYEKIQVQSC